MTVFLPQGGNPRGARQAQEPAAERPGDTSCGAGGELVGVTGRSREIGPRIKDLAKRPGGRDCWRAASALPSDRGDAVAHGGRFSDRISGEGGRGFRAAGTGRGSSSDEPILQDETPLGAPCSREDVRQCEDRVQAPGVFFFSGEAGGADQASPAQTMRPRRTHLYRKGYGCDLSFATRYRGCPADPRAVWQSGNRPAGTAPLDPDQGRPLRNRLPGSRNAPQ